MWPDVPASSTSTNSPLVRVSAQALYASWRAFMKQRLARVGTLSYVAIWVALPVFQLAVTGLIYRGVRPGLLSYSVVGVAASSFIFNTLYYVGQMLDEERINGTLVGLFLAPCPRFSWLIGFALGGLVETLLAAASTVIFGMLAFGVRFDPDYPALIVSFLLYLASLWGLGFVFSAIGLIIKRSNDLANLISPFTTLLGGVYFPVALLPLWLQIPARCLPIGYGVQAMAGAALHHAGFDALAPQLLPLACFAAALPLIGVQVFNWLERGVRQRGELDLY